MKGTPSSSSLSRNNIHLHVFRSLDRPNISSVNRIMEVASVERQIQNIPVMAHHMKNNVLSGLYDSTVDHIHRSGILTHMLDLLTKSEYNDNDEDVAYELSFESSNDDKEEMPFLITNKSIIKIDGKRYLNDVYLYDYDDYWNGFGGCMKNLSEDLIVKLLKKYETNLEMPIRYVRLYESSLIIKEIDLYKKQAKM